MDQADQHAQCIEHIQALLNNNIDDITKENLLAKIKACDRCNAIYEMDLTIKTLIQQLVGKVEAPADLIPKIQAIVS